MLDNLMEYLQRNDEEEIRELLDDTGGFFLHLSERNNRKWMRKLLVLPTRSLSAVDEGGAGA